MENNQNNYNYENQEIKYGRLDKEIKREEKEHRLNNKKPKSKKDLKKKILAWGLTASIVAGAAIGGTAIITDQTKGNGAYNKEIEKKYEQVDETLSKAMAQTPYRNSDTSNVTGLCFEGEMSDGKILKVFYEKDDHFDDKVVRRDRYADFSVEKEDYNNLVEAEKSDNMLIYLDCLNELFSNMSYISKSSKFSEFTIKLPENTSDNIAIFNQIFSIDKVKTEDTVSQVGFMPYFIDLAEKKIDKEANRTYYTYKIYGLSYCKTNSENSCYVKPSDRLIIGDYDKNHIKSFNRVITFESYTDQTIIFEDLRLSGDIYKIICGVNNPYTVTDYFFEDAELFDDYFMMQDGHFDYKMPEGFVLDEYFNSQEENIK